eukprot:TRINITY_DN5683_c0_g1::TRINITY_DN5683_c0_g1_i1::g.12099::m.12099 TRINITY_DN5683_c0_g1::TRINITY_DN5683_c0_g1_i1::g.12099  ORF type:complete len:209 (-),score=54.34,WWE/PF02825.15/0.00026 TRINITY_DN5683_c0_g1_i1:39-665(-)
MMSAHALVLPILALGVEGAPTPAPAPVPVAVAVPAPAPPTMVMQWQWRNEAGKFVAYDNDISAILEVAYAEFKQDPNKSTVRISVTKPGLTDPIDCDIKLDSMIERNVISGFERGVTRDFVLVYPTPPPTPTPTVQVTASPAEDTPGDDDKNGTPRATITDLTEYTINNPALYYGLELFGFPQNLDAAEREIHDTLREAASRNATVTS